MKRLLSLATLLLLAVASFAHDFEVGGIYYVITSSSSTSPTVEVSYKGASYDSYSNEYIGNVTIPKTVTYSGKTYSVTSIGERAFYKCTGLTSITIPESVTAIGDDAFLGCSGLTSITIPEGVTSIGDYAFRFCSGLTSINIPSSVTSIGNGAFSYCSGLTSITIPSSVTSIGSEAFGGCSGLTSIIIPSSVTSIGSSAFSGCSGLTSITIPENVTTIGIYAFSGCSGLTSITIPSSVTSIGSSAFSGCSGLTGIDVDAGNSKYDSRDNCNAVIETSSNELIAGCKTTTIPSSVTSIGSSAFNGCSGLTSITIPSSVTTIDSGAFGDCSGLASITIPESVTSISSSAFYNTAWLNNQPDGLVYAGKVAYTYKGTMPSGTSITLEEGTMGIADYAFYGGSGLKSITIPGSVKSIGSDAFSGCSGLTSVTISEGVTSIGSRAFSDCSGLTSITIPSTVTTIGYWAFTNCINLQKVIVPDVAKWCAISFNGAYANPLGHAQQLYSDENTEIKELTIPSNVTRIGDYAFYNCRSLTSITIPSSVTSIGSEAFSYCKGLTSITIPSSVTSIGGSAFYYCTDTKFYVDKNTIALFVLWRQILDKPKTGYPKYASENVYDINTGEKIEFFKTTASSVRVVSPEAKNYTITSQSLTANGYNAESPYYAGGLSPNTNSNVSLTIKYKDAEGSENTFYTTQTVKTQPLTLTTEQPKVVSMGNVVVSATTNVDADEKNVGFEWRRTDWTSDFASNSGSAVVYGNTMEGYIRNMNTDKLWKYRAYYLSDDGTYYYGDWVGLDASNTSYFEPTVHTYADISTSGKVALIRGYVLNGTDKVTVQGFKYWKTANKSNNLDIAMEAKPQAAVVSVPAYAITETVAIVGAGQQMMNATLENLDYGSTYQCVAFATTSENETFYGEVQSFTTEAAPTGIEGVKEDAGSSKPVTVVACYDINGKQLSAPQKGLNLLRMSDGTTRKVVR